MCIDLFKDRLLNIFGKSKAKPKDSAVTEYKRELMYLQSRLSKVQSRFDIETDDSKIEALIYEEISINIRIDSLIKNAKQSKLSIEEYKL